MNRKTNILYISSYSTMRGGGQRSMYLLIKYLDKSKYTPFLIMPDEGELADEIRKLGGKVSALTFPRIRSLNIFKIVNAFVKLVKNIRVNSIDLVHADSPREALFAGLAGKLLRIPVVCHLRVSDSDVWLDKILYRFTDCFIAVSHAVTRRFADIDNKNKIHVVYNGVELEKYIVSSWKKLGPCLKIGYFGRIDRRKGIDILVNAVRLLKENVGLLIMGEGDEDYRAELEKMSEGTNTIFRGYKPNVLNEMSSVDVIVLPSHYGEGLSRVIIESMALGKIIVVSDLKENIEAIGEELKKSSFPVGNYKKLANILKEVAEKKDIPEEKKNLFRKRAELLFDIRKNTKQIEKIYDKLFINNKR